jgi:membrane protease YdiL (CAAX protease family)
MTIRDGVDRHPVAAFLLLAYGVSWPAWTLQTVLSDSSPLAATAAFALAGFGPAIAAAAVVALGEGSLREWAGRTFRVRLPLRYYAVALALPVVGVALAGGIHVAAFRGVATLEDLPALVEYPIYLGFVVLLFGGQEEPGWRGFALPRLSRTRPRLVAALLVGVAWVGWHLPLFVLPDTIQGEILFPLYAVQLLAMSVILAWLTVAARWSVIPAVLLHAGGNAVANFYPVGGPEGAVSVVGYGLLTALLAVVAAGIAFRFGPSLRAGDPGSPEVPAGAD